jgi:hypothetical protein
VKRNVKSDVQELNPEPNSLAHVINLNINTIIYNVEYFFGRHVGVANIRDIFAKKWFRKIQFVKDVPQDTNWGLQNYVVIMPIAKEKNQM